MACPLPTDIDSPAPVVGVHAAGQVGHPNQRRQCDELPAASPRRACGTGAGLDFFF